MDGINFIQVIGTDHIVSGRFCFENFESICVSNNSYGNSHFYGFDDFDESVKYHWTDVFCVSSDSRDIKIQNKEIIINLSLIYCDYIVWNFIKSVNGKFVMNCISSYLFETERFYLMLDIVDDFQIRSSAEVTFGFDGEQIKGNFEIRFYFIEDNLNLSLVTIIGYMPTEDVVADILTKFEKLGIVQLNLMEVFPSFGDFPVGGVLEL
jgi:hypothetical protein